MKTKNILVYGIFAVILMFAFIACDDGNDPNNGNGDPNGGGGKASFGDKLELSGQVYTVDWDDNDEPVYTKFEGNLTLSAASTSIDGNEVNIGGAGEIKGGKLTYTVGTPPASSLSSITSLFGEPGYTNITISDESIKFARFHVSIKVTGSNTYDYVININDYTTQESVMFMYVDNPVTITAKGGTETEEGHTPWKHNDINLSLKKGWNALIYSYKTEEGSFTSSVSVGNPDLKWVLGIYGEETETTAIGNMNGA